MSTWQAESAQHWKNVLDDMFGQLVETDRKPTIRERIAQRIAREVEEDLITWHGYPPDYKVEPIFTGGSNANEDSAAQNLGRQVQETQDLDTQIGSESQGSVEDRAGQG